MVDPQGSRRGWVKMMTTTTTTTASGVLVDGFPARSVARKESEVGLELLLLQAKGAPSAEAEVWGEGCCR